VKAAVQPGYNLLDARLGYAFDGGRAEVALFAKSLTDETYFNEVLSFLTLSGALIRYYQPPRTWGGEVSYRF
jgi:outer membrane receptor protein involved in Fe transport